MKCQGKRNLSTFIQFFFAHHNHASELRLITSGEHSLLTINFNILVDGTKDEGRVKEG